jgi:hypothetical protein
MKFSGGEMSKSMSPIKASSSRQELASRCLTIQPPKSRIVLLLHSVAQRHCWATSTGLVQKVDVYPGWRCAWPGLWCFALSGRCELCTKSIVGAVSDRDSVYRHTTGCISSKFGVGDASHNPILMQRRAMRRREREALIERHTHVVGRRKPHLQCDKVTVVNPSSRR